MRVPSNVPAGDRAGISRFWIVTTSLLFIFGALVMARAQTEQHSLLTRHVREAFVSGEAAVIGSLPGIQGMHLAMMLPVWNQAALDELLQELYDPRAVSYHQRK